MRHTPWIQLVWCSLGVAALSCGQGAETSRSELGESSAAVSGAEAHAALTPKRSDASLRAALIAARQQGAGESFAARPNAGQLVARAVGFGVRYDQDGAHLGREKVEHGALSLAAVGCAGALELAPVEAPSFEKNRVSYARHAAGVPVTEWYLTGPMGLEQGFTLVEAPECTLGGDELVLEVAVADLAVQSQGEVIVLEAASGERYRYSDLLAKDATGRELPARMAVTPEGRIALSVNVQGAVFPVEVDPLVATEIVKLTASDGATGDDMGNFVSFSGDKVLAGAAGDDSAKGSAYVFTRTGTTWAEQAKLVASDGAADDKAGFAVSLSGDTAVLGAPGDDASKGGAYVFTRAGTAWTQQAKITAADGAAGDEFAYTVAIDGNTLVVGAWADEAYKGSTYVFTRSGTAWTQQAKLLASDGAADDGFGSLVAVQGDTLVSTAYGDDAYKGSAYVFTRSGTAWTQQAKLVASDGAANDSLGISVSLDGSTTILGASGDDAYKGSAYVFTRSGTAWTQQAKLTAADGVADDGFGFAVSVAGNSALVGSYFDDDKGTNSGSAYLFLRSGTTWAQETKLTASDGAANEEFGFSVAVTGDTAIVGADRTEAQKGGVYVFSLKRANGDGCLANAECTSGFCVDGVCCDTACAGGANDCQACSTAAGAAANGTCGPSTGNTCDDGNGCTQTDTCQAGTCTGANPVTCTAADECREAGSCDSNTGKCSSPSKPDGTPCLGGACQGGACVPNGIGGVGGGGTGATAGTGASWTGGFGGTGGGVVTGGTGGGSSGSSDDGGCGCRTTGSERGSGYGAALLMLLGLAARRRRGAAR